MKKMFKRSVSILLSIIMIVSVFTIIPFTADAASGLLWKRVWYFNREYTIIEDNSNGYNSGYVTLLPTEYIALSPFESRDPKTVWTEDLGYAHSTVKNLLDSWVQPGGLLEREAFAMRTVNVPDEGVYGVKCYLLNATEARRLPQSVLDDGSYFIWWLRDTDQYHQFASDVAPGNDHDGEHGFVREVGVTDPGNKYPWGTWVTNEQGVRPAFQIDLSKAPYDAEHNALLYTCNLNYNSAHISTDATVNYMTDDLHQRGMRGEIKTIKFHTHGGYLFPETSELYKTVNGITVERTADNEVTVSGSLTGNVDVQIPDNLVTLPATEPTITRQPEGLTMPYYEDGHTLTIAATAPAGHTISYQWYCNTTDSNTGGWGDGYNHDYFHIPYWSTNAGTYYYYCVVTARRSDNGQTASVTSDTAKVVVTKLLADRFFYDYLHNNIEKFTDDEDFKNTPAINGDGRAVNYTSSNTNVATVNPNTGMVSIVGEGETTISCSAQDGTNYYYSTRSASYKLTVKKHDGSISYAKTKIAKYPDDKAFTNPLTHEGDGAVTYKSSNTNVATVDANTGEVTIVAAGKATITATTADTHDYAYETKTASYNITVTKRTQELYHSPVIATYGDTGLKVYARSDGDGVLSYQVVSGNCVTVDENGNLTVLRAGNATVRVTAAETHVYAKGTVDVPVTIKKLTGYAATVTNVNRPYDGTEKPLITVDNSTLDGGTMQYALGTNATTVPTSGWSEDIPTATDIGRYFVWSKFIADENHTTPDPTVATSVIVTYYIERAYENGKVTQARHDMPYSTTFLYADNIPGTLSEGWYVLTEDASCGNLTVSGDVHLVLMDGTTLTVSGSITNNGTLNIYGQNEGSGKLSVAVNGKEAICGGSLVIHDCEISATETSNYAAISSEDVTIYAGSLSAIARLGAGIGGGVWNGYNGTVRIYGGSVYAQNTPLPEAGFTDGEGIGAGCNGSGSGTLILGAGVGLVDGDGYTLAAPSEQEQTVTARAPIMKTGTGTVTKPVSYKSASYNESTGKVEFTEKTVSDYKFLSSQTNWKDGWFVVNKDVTFTTNVTIEGTVNLIICDGATLNLDGYCIEMEDGDTLNIYGGAKGTGKLVVGNDDYNAGIGCYYGDEIGGTLAIHGCEIIAKGGDYKGTSGISVQDVTIYAGNVMATGYAGAGIGSVKGVDYTGTVRIYGGDVTAISQKDESGAQGSGIGAGSGGQEEVAAGPQITVTASQITADMASNINDVSEMPVDFVQTDLSTARAWSDAPQGFVHLLYAVDENWMYVVDFLNGKAMSGGYYFRASDLSLELSYFFGRDEAVYYVTDYSSTPVENDRFTLILGAGIGLVDGKGKTIAPPQDEVQTVTERNSTMKTGVEVPSEPVSYVEKGTEKSCEDYELFDGSTTELENGWYVVNGTVTVSNRISVSGDVKLILCDGAQLTCEKGIALTDGNTLSIYGQTAGSGKLTAATNEYQYAAIGVNYSTNAGVLKVYGGQIYAMSSDYGTPAIGANNRNSGSLYVAGGKLVLANSDGGKALQISTITVEDGMKVFQGYEANPETTGEEVNIYQLASGDVTRKYVTIVSESDINPDDPGANTIPGVARLTREMFEEMNSLIDDMPSDFIKIDEEIAREWECTASGEAYLIYNTENGRYLQAYRFDRHGNPMNSEIIFDLYELQDAMDRGEVYYVSNNTQGSEGGDEPGENTVPAATRLTRDMIKDMNSLIDDMPSDFTKVDEVFARKWESTASDEAYLIYNTENDRYLKALLFDPFGNPMHSEEIMDVDDLDRYLDRGEVYYVSGTTQASGGSEEPEEPSNKTVPTVARLTSEMFKEMTSLVGDMPSDFTKIEDSIAPNWDCTVSGRAYLIYNTKDDSSLKIFIFRDGKPSGFSTISDLDDLEMHLDEGEVYYVTGTTGGSGQSEEPSVVDIPTITKLSDISELDAALAAMGSCTEDEARAWIDANADALSAIGHNAFVIFSVNQGDEVSYRVFVRILSGHVNGPFNIPADEIKDAIEEGDADVYIAGGSGQGEEPGGGDEPATFTITWKNEDGSIIDTTEVNEGAVPTHADPTKAADAQYTYTFAGWTPDVVAADSDAAYTATFSSTVNEYTVTWIDGDGNTIKTEQVAYGETPSYDTEADGIPTKSADAEYTYSFAGVWSPSVEAVTADATYTAQFNATNRFYTIIWKNEDGSVADTTEAMYGNTPFHDVLTKDEDDEFTYEFAGWTPELTAVTGDAEYTATFTAIAKPVEEPIEEPVIKNGPNENGCFYNNDVLVKAYRLVEFEGDWYFIAENHKYVVNQTRYLKDSIVKNTGFAAGYYQFDELGRMQIPHDGPDADGYFYINNEKQKAYKLICFEGDWYFIAENNKFVTNAHRYLNADTVEGTGFTAGYYDFDENGKMIIRNGIIDDRFYVNGVQQKAYKLIEIDGDWYFIAENNKIVKSVRRYLNESMVEGTDFAVGYYEFDGEGKMVYKNGPDTDGYFYLNNEKQKAYKLIYFEGNYYFVVENHKYAKNARRYLNASIVEGTGLKAGYYEFDAYGNMILA